MEYKLSIEQLRSGKMFDSNGKFYHNSGYTFKLFPFVTARNDSMSVLELESLVGTFLCIVEDKTPKSINASALIDELMKETEIQAGQEELFREIIRKLFFQDNGMFRPLNLQFLEHIPYSRTSEYRVAEYLVDVLGNKTILKNLLENAKQQERANSNVLETYVLSKLECNENKANNSEIPYFRVVDSLKQTFEEDFAFILENAQRAREYLVALLELYYFSYTAQTCLQLNRFMSGERNKNIPLYFCLEWEKTSQSRLCYREGWQKLQRAIEKIFAHVIVLELLNQTEEGSDTFDYIKIAENITDEITDGLISEKIDAVTNCYRESITDCQAMSKLQKRESGEGATAASIKYLFECVRTQFENSIRNSAYRSYAKKFELYCNKFLKNRGRSGAMLNISEETLIFVTRLSIKHQEKLRLIDVFKEFEKRGIFLDDISKEQVAQYYEKLNLIEKKSDSGDAKYVKQIL